MDIGYVKSRERNEMRKNGMKERAIWSITRARRRMMKKLEESGV